MRKVLSIVLALAMVLGCFASVFAASFSDVTADDDFAPAVNVLTDLGVISGYTDGNFKPGNVVTRAEMAAMIVNALGIPNVSKTATKFSDVTAEDWFSGYVYYAESMNILKGYTDGTFKPTKTVSYDEAITMIVQALGYTADSLTGTYPAAFISKAKSLGILEGITTLGSDGANRGDIATMLYNTLDQRIGHVDKDGTFVAATNPIDCMFIRLGADGGDAIEIACINEEHVADAYVDISEYLGAKVKAFTKDGDILAIYEVESEFYTGKADNGTTKKIGDYKISKISGTYPVFVNGEMTTSSAAITDIVSTYDKKDVTVSGSFSGNYITKVVSFLVWEPAATVQATKDMIKTLADKDTFDGKKFPMTSKDEIDTDAVTLVGIESLDDLAEDMVVTYYLNGEGKIIKMEVSDKTVTGKMTKKTTSKVTVDGTAYAYDSSVAGISALNFTDEFVLYFDYAGNLFAVEAVEGETATTYYGVLLAKGYTTGSTGDWTNSTKEKDVRQVKLFTQEGEEVVYTVDNTMTGTGTSATFKYLPAFTSKNAGPALYQVYAYTLNEDGEILTLEDAGLTATGTTKKVSAKGVLNGKYFATDAIIFVKSGDDYSILAADKVANVEFDAVPAYKLNTKNTIAVMFASNGTVSTEKLGIYAGTWTQIASDKYELAFFEDGAETTKTYKGTAAPSFAAGVVLKLTEADGILTEAPEKTGFVEEIVNTTAGSVSGNTFSVDDTSYAIDAEAEFYVVTLKTDGTVKSVALGTIADLDKLAVDKSVKFYNLDTDTDVYELVVIYK